jgi:hypothetical protein
MMGSELGDVLDSIYSVTDSGVLDFRMLLDGKRIGLEQRIEVHSPIGESFKESICLAESHVPKSPHILQPKLWW